jgi:fibronectin-binding autotransporter adhesin
MKFHSMQFLFVGFVAVNVSSGALRAQTATYNDSQGDESWSDAANWTPNLVPGVNAFTGQSTNTQGYNVVIGTGGALPNASFANPILLDTGSTVVNQNSVSIGNLTFDNTSDVSIGDTGTGETLTITGTTGILNTTAASQKLTVNLVAGANDTYSGGTAGGNLLLGDSFGGSLNLQTFNITMTGTVTVFSSDVISDSGGGKLTIGNGTVASTVSLSGQETYSGGTTIQNAGVLVVGLLGGSPVITAGALTSGQVGTGLLTIGTGATLKDNGTAQTLANSVSLAGNITLASTGAGSLTFDGTTLTTPSTVTLTANTNLAVNNTTTIADVISGAFSLTQSGTGNLILTAANTFSGATTVSAGTVTLKNSLALQNSTVATGGTLVFDSSVGSHAFTFGGLSGAGNLALLDNAGTPNAVALTIGNNNSTNTFSGVLSGTGSLIKIGTGNQTLSGINTYTGVTTITAGTLTINGSTVAASAVGVGTAGTLAGSGTIGGNTTVTGNGIINLTGGTISGTLGITGGNWNGTGTVGGQVTASSGTFTIGTGANLTATTGTAVTGTGVIVAAAASSTLTSSLNYTSTSASTFQGVIAGAGHTVTLNSTGTTLTLSGTNTYTGATAITSGTLALNGSTAAGSAVDVASATSTLSGTGTANGNVTVEGGTINMTGGHIGGTLTATGGANINGTETVAGQVTSGSGAFTIGTGANLTATTGVNITGGTLAAAGASGTITGNVNYTSATNSTFQGIIAGTGKTLTLNHAGTTLTLSGANTYTGATTVSAGTLLVGGSTAAGSAVTIGNNTGVATLAGTGTLNGSVALASTGGNVAHLAPGATTGSAGTLHVGSLNIGTGSELDIDLATATTVGSNVNDLVTLAGGTLTFGGNTLVNINSLGTLTTGTAYTLINGAGTITGFNAANFTVSGVPNTLTTTFSTSGGALLVTFANVSTTAYYYNGNGTNPAIFNNADNYQTTATGGTAPTQNLDGTTGTVDVYLGATTGPGAIPAPISVALSAAATINSLNFTAATGAGATVSGASALTIEGGGISDLSSGATETISAPVVVGASQTWNIANASSTLVLSGGLSGSAPITKTGNGIVLLNSANTESSAFAVNAGYLEVGASGALGTSTGVSVASGATLKLLGTTTTGVPLTVNGTGVGGVGALESAGNSSLSGAITLGSASTLTSDSGTLTLGGGITGSGIALTLSGAGNGLESGVIATGAGTVTKTGAGTWTVSGVNTFTGATTITTGTLAIGAGGSLASSSGVAVAGAATFDVSTAGNQTIKDLSSAAANSAVVLGANTLTEGTTNSTTFAGVISGTGGALTKVGTGTLTLAGANTLTGGVNVNGGVLSIGAFAANLADITSFSLGGGELLTTANSSTTDTATLNTGTDTLAAATSTTASYNGVISSGTGANLNLGDASNHGTIILGANNTYTGTTTIAAATTVQVGNAGTTGSVGGGAVTDNGSLVYDRTNTATVANAISGTGTLTQAGSGTLVLSGTNTFGGGTTISNGVLSVASANTNLGTGNVAIGAGELVTTTTSTTTKTVALTTGNSVIAAGAGTTATYGGVISGTALTVGDGTNTGTVVVNAAETYTGGTTVADGTFQIGAGSTTGSVLGNIVDDSAVAFNHTGTFTYGGIISGTGTLTSTQATLVLTGTNTYSGATAITAGTVQLSGTGSIANSAVTTGSGTTLAATGTTNSIGDLVVNSGTVSLLNNASNTLNASTLTVGVSGGSLSIDVGATTGGSDLLAIAGAALLNGTLVVNVDSLANAAIGTHYTFLTAASGLAANDFTLGTLSGTFAGDSVTFGISGNSAYLQINGPAVNSYFYTGATSNDFTDITNYNTSASGNTIQTTPFSTSADVTIGTTSPMPMHLNPISLASNLAIHSLNFATTGSGATISGAGTLTIGAGGVTVQTGVAGTETIASAVALSASQTWTVTSAGSTLVDSGGISGGFGLTKAGAGTLVFSGVNTYTGATIVNAGALNLQNNGALNGTSGVTVASGGALQLQGGITTAATPLNLSGTGTGNGALENVSGANTYAGAITLGAAATIGSDAGTLNLTSGTAISGSGAALTLAGAGNGVVNSGIATGTGTLTKSGTGTWTLNGANTFTGATTIAGGTLTVGAASSLATSSGVNLTSGTSVLDVSAANQVIQDLAGVAGSTVNVGGNTLSVGSANSTTYAGTIIGTNGNLNKQGTGSLTLTGTNTYTGLTTMSGGKLIVAAVNTNLGAGNLVFAGGELVTTTTSATAKNASLQAGTDTIAAANSTTATYSGTISGPGTLTIGDGINNGTVLLTGNNTYSNAHIVSGTTQVGSATALGVGDVTLSGGVLTVGNGQNQINVAGNYTQTGGTLVLNLSGTAPGANPGYQFLNVTGTAALGGGLQVIVSNAYVPVVGDMFTFVQAGNITGGFSSVSTNLYSLQITAQGAGVIISQLPFATLPGVDYSANEVSIARYVDSAFQSGAQSPAFQALLASLNSLTANGSGSLLPDAFSQLSPEKFADFTRSNVFNNASFNTQLFDNYFEGQRSAHGDFIASNGQLDSSGLTIMDPSMDPGLAQMHSQLLAWTPAPIGHGLLSDSTDPVIAGLDMKELKSNSGSEVGDPFSTFIIGSVILGQTFSQSDVPHSDTTTGAVQIGADYRITPHLRVGATFGYGHTDANLDNNGSKASLDSYSPGVYASYAQNGWYANALASYGFDNFTEDRSVDFGSISSVSHGSPNGYQIVANLDGGYDFHVKNWTFGPLAGLQYVHLNVDSYSESGSDPVDLKVDESNTDSLRSRVGGHVSYVFQTGKVLLKPHLDAAWQHDFMDQARGITAQFSSVGAGSFTVLTPNPSRDSALIDGGLTADLNGTVSLSLDYLVQAGQSNYFGQSVQAGVRIGF